MNPAQLIAQMRFLAENPPNTRPFADAAQRAVVKSQTDLARFNPASSTSFAVDATDKRVSVRWRTVRTGSGGQSRLSPSAAIRTHLSHEMATAREEFTSELTKRLAP